MLSQKNNPSLFFFYLLILFLPTQVGKHFWLQSSFVYGLRIDYLSPTLYLTDILILIILIFFFLKRIKDGNIFKKINSKNAKLIAITAVILLGSSIFAKNQHVSFYGLVKFLEFLFLSIFIVNTIKSFKTIFIVLSFSVIYESVIAIAQFLSKGSLGGGLYFLGERTFTGQTPGIANASLGGELILRAYGTFSHPNVLAGFLVVIMSAILVKMLKEKNSQRIIYWLAMVLGTIALFLTLSRVAIIIWFISLFLILLAKHKLRKKTFWLFMTVLFFLLSLFIFFPLFLRFTEISLSQASIHERILLMQIAFQMFIKNPIFGVGINNFIVMLPAITKIKSLYLLQPAHNIYFLILAETGILGFFGFILLIFYSIKRISKVSPFFPSIIIILFLGLFDHYFLTLQQGQLLLSIVLGFCWVKTSS
ncbi:MAG TPA: O-antigen ligase family protein [Patescibacteria group bacterium]|nr:O-antigen ligase family protein [Patescibacteria group bacterium]